MQDIADKLGITKVSVSKAVNNKPGVGDKLRRQILKTAQEMGYTNQRPANSKNSFAFVVPRRFFLETDKFYNVIFYHLNKLYIGSGSTLTSIVIDLESEETAADSALYAGFDGIYMAGELSDTYTQMLSKTGTPLVAIDFYKTNLSAAYVLIDNYYLGYHATSFLIDKGHREIGFVGNINQTSSINDRYFGYLKALQNKGLSINDQWIIPNNDPKTGMYEIDIPFPEKLPTAFVCHCDMAAYFLANSLKRLNLSVPGDVSLISFDNTDLSAASGLTSMDIDRQEMAETAFYLMEQIINGKKHRNRYYITASLIDRNSVLPLQIV